MFKNRFFYRTPPVAAFEIINKVLQKSFRDIAFSISGVISYSPTTALKISVYVFSINFPFSPLYVLRKMS